MHNTRCSSGARCARSAGGCPWACTPPRNPSPGSRTIEGRPAVRLKTPATLALRVKAFALLAATLLVLVGFAGAVAEPLAVTEPVAAGTESGSPFTFGGNGLAAT